MTARSLIVLLFMGFVAGLVFAGKLPLAVLEVYLAASLIAFAVYAWDKSAARNQQWRTPENTLHLLALLGGWPGALIAQQRLRHKTKKMSFLVMFWGTVVLNCGTLWWWLR
jgi:uncharacterized membrane protein YsdA (DUF1294 family)